MFSYTDGDIVALRNFAAEHKITLTENEEFSDTIEKGKFISVSLNFGPLEIIIFTVVSNWTINVSASGVVEILNLNKVKVVK